jgi:hypothetical protein
MLRQIAGELERKFRLSVATRETSAVNEGAKRVKPCFRSSFRPFCRRRCQPAGLFPEEFCFAKAFGIIKTACRVLAVLCRNFEAGATGRCAAPASGGLES